MPRFQPFFVLKAFISLIGCSVAVVYVPPSRSIETVQDDTYTFGIEDDGELEIAKCTVTADTGQNHSFPVLFPTGQSDHTQNYQSKQDLLALENIIKDKGRQGLCQVEVSNVQETGPRVWTLEVKDFENAIVLKTTFSVKYFSKGVLLGYDIRIEEFASFTNYLVFNEGVTLKSCYAKINDSEKIDLDLQATKRSLVNLYLSNSDEILTRVSSLGHGLCGFKFINATKAIRAARWSITATDDGGKSYRGVFTTRINDRISDYNRYFIKGVALGTPSNVSCGFPLTGKFCSIFNPKGVLVEPSKCGYGISSFTMDDVGVWRCYRGEDTNMEGIDYTVELIPTSIETVVAWSNETDDYVNIGCYLNNYKGRTIGYCKMVAPNERIFNIKTYSATNRYLTIGTNFTIGICQMQIKKPLQEFEKGLWRCEIQMMYRNVTGSFIRVGRESPKVDYPKHLVITTRMDEPFTIHCKVPYDSPYCRIQAPNGTRYPPKSDAESHLGRCTTTIQHSQSSDNGTWVCLFARDSGQPDDEIIVEVTVAEVLSYFKYVEVDEGDATNILCSTGGAPIEYCRFTSPEGKGYHMYNHDVNSTRISYYGKGFEHGECGISIPYTRSRDSGWWTCTTKVIEDRHLYGEVSAKIMLDVAAQTSEGLNVAAIGIGSFAGIALIGSIFGLFVYRKWRRRAHAEVTGSVGNQSASNDGACNQNADNVSENSETNLFEMANLRIAEPNDS